MSYSQAAYWQAQANACKGYADEGACLERVARHAGGLTIVPGFGGLGQADDAVTYAAGSAELRAIQTALMNAGALGIRTADGRIDADNSPTLAAIRTWASSRGWATSSIRRTASGGLSLPAGIAASILGTAAPTSDGAAPTKGTPTVAPSATLPDPALTRGDDRRWTTWVAIGAGTAVAAGFVFLLARQR